MLGTIVGLTLGASAWGVVSGAAFTSTDATLGGCFHSYNGVNCNHYVGKSYVYLEGGPPQGGWSLSDGDYFFAVLAPGAVQGGFLDGAEGNLSDAVAGGTAGDLGSGDDVGNRTFSLSGGELTFYAGTHLLGTSPAGRVVIGVAPFDDTPNNGGVYILAVCPVGAVAPSSCRFDAFKVGPDDEPELDMPILSGGKYYDANTNGQRDVGEVGLGGWAIAIADDLDEVIATDPDGSFEVQVTPDAYHLAELDGGPAWIQTGNTVSQLGTTGDAVAILDGDMSYDVVVGLGDGVDGLLFGNVCLGAGGGRTLGY